MKKLQPLFTLLLLTSLFVSCEKEENDITGCTDPLSYSYNSDAVSDNGSCQYYYGGREKGQLDVGSEIDMNNEFDIYVDGEFVGRLSFYFPGGLECGNPNAVGSIFASGNHTVRAVGNGGSPVREGIINLEAQDCKVILVENLPLIGGGGGGGNATGDAIFWVNSDFGCGPITVNLSGVGSTTINGFFGSAPNCTDTGSGGNFNNLNPGVYSFTASCSSQNWSGSITITENGCLRQELTSSGGGGGGSNTGDVIFWTNTDLGCGPISVTVSGVGGSTITGYYGSTPNCSNSSAGGNFNNLAVGNYSFTANCNGYNWSGNFTVSEDVCLTYQLY
ncbi:hypothetical protein ATE92_0323 [Ulvibacter sp. MAR_2010_11]|uniref:hypothetical protein n=1 Tax=Ulvibacter sp. MAR_2010_11 TaxID=1250229 RepID=UPI000C2B7EE2|nr:hypothetical protein [Ulvibacter sp. MAR_2010_11]PKA82197.1 hypothetical protein ATE92_0323 [Ulvibacter sp. MAR_2010_11]